MSDILPRVEVLIEGHNKLCPHPIERIAWHTQSFGAHPSLVIASCRACGRSLSLYYDRLMKLDDLIGAWPAYQGKPL